MTRKWDVEITCLECDKIMEQIVRVDWNLLIQCPNCKMVKSLDYKRLVDINPIVPETHKSDEYKERVYQYIKEKGVSVKFIEIPRDLSKRSI